jgi:hypothetical protein
MTLQYSVIASSAERTSCSSGVNTLVGVGVGLVAVVPDDKPELVGPGLGGVSSALHAAKATAQATTATIANIRCRMSLLRFISRKPPDPPVVDTSA